MVKESLVSLLNSTSRMETNEFFTCDMIADECFNCFEFDRVLRRNKLQLLFFKHLKSIECLNKFDKELIEEYSYKLFYLQFKYKEYLSLVRRIVHDFDEIHINYAILKGMSFIEDLYSESEIIYRTFGDVDILISPSDISKVNDVLSELGLIQGKICGNRIEKAKRNELIYWKLNSHQLHEYVKFSSYSSISPNFAIYVDVNTTIFEGGKTKPPICTEEVLAHIMTKNIGGQKIKCLNYTYGLLQLCYHFYKDTIYESKKKSHNDYCLLKFCDIREYIFKYRSLIQWETFIDIVNRFNVGNEIYYVLMLVSSFYGDLMIETVLSSINTKQQFIDKSIDWYNLFCI